MCIRNTTHKSLSCSFDSASDGLLVSAAGVRSPEHCFHGDRSHTLQMRGIGQSCEVMQNAPPLMSHSWSTDWRHATAARHTDGHG